MIEKIITALRSITSAPESEKHLHQQMADAFDAAGILFQREVPTETGPADFVVDETCVVEVKIKGSAMAVTRQLARYLQDDRFTCGVVVTTRPLVLPLSALEGKSVHVIELWRNFFQCTKSPTAISP